MGGRISKSNNVLGDYRKRLLPRNKDIGLGLSRESKSNKESAADEILSKLAARAIKSFRKRVLK